MKNITRKKAFLAASLIFTTSLALADEKSGSLGNTLSATDYYTVNCFDDGNGAANQLSVEVIDQTPVKPPLVSVQVVKGLLAANATDQVDADTAYSPTITVKGGAGTYTVLVTKTKGATESYSLTMHCETSGDVHTGTTITSIQNQ